VVWARDSILYLPITDKGLIRILKTYWSPLIGEIKVGLTLLHCSLSFVVVVYHLQIRVVATLGTGDLPLSILDRIQAILYFLDLFLHRIHYCSLKVADCHQVLSIPLVFMLGPLRGTILVVGELRIELGFWRRILVLRKLGVDAWFPCRSICYDDFFLQDYLGL
jgi:hypothetical protein